MQNDWILTFPFSTSSFKLQSMGSPSSSALVRTFLIWTTSSRFSDKHSIAVCQWFDWKNSSWSELFDIECGSFPIRRWRIGEARVQFRFLNTFREFVYSKGNDTSVAPYSSRLVGLQIVCLLLKSRSSTLLFSNCGSVGCKIPVSIHMLVVIVICIFSPDGFLHGDAGVDWVASG